LRLTIGVGVGIVAASIASSLVTAPVGFGLSLPAAILVGGMPSAAIIGDRWQKFLSLAVLVAGIATLTAIVLSLTSTTI
jgi:hypothetical protein